jgi:hypothetical protein
MPRRAVRTLCLVLAGLAWLAMPARAQSDSADAAAAAKELVETIDLAAQFKALMPAIMQNLRPAIVQGRADVAKDYDEMTPVLLEGFQARIGELADAVTAIYAANFSADELRAVTAFYKTPAGQTFLQKSPALTQQTMAAGQKFGQAVGSEMQKRMIEELRKKGHTL